MFLGIEIGGTKLQLGLGPGDGNIVALWRGPVDREAGGEGIRNQITAAVPELLRQAGACSGRINPATTNRSQLKGVGVGFGGPVDDATRTVIKSHQIEGWDNFPLADWIGDMLGLPVALGNDADVAGLAEALFGAGKGLSPIFYITIGSGIGGGLIINGEIYRGCGRGAAEIGHLRVRVGSLSGVADSDGPLDFTLLERVASGWGIHHMARAHADLQPHEPFLFVRLANNKPGDISAQHVTEASQHGDRMATQILEFARKNLAEGICHVIALLCPRRIVIGGGVSLMGEELLFQPLRKLVAERVFKPFADCYDIVPAALGEEVVVHGALALARQRLSA